MSFCGLIAHFFLALHDIPSSGWTTVCFCIHQGHHGYFQVLSIINKAAINIPVQVFCADISFQFFWVNNERVQLRII